MQTSTNIFYKIFQIMDHYENILEKQSYKGEKYKPGGSFDDFMKSDDFFSSVFQSVPVKKKEPPPETNPSEDNPPETNPSEDNLPQDNSSDDPTPDPPRDEDAPHEEDADHPPEDKTSDDQDDGTSDPQPQAKTDIPVSPERILAKYIKKCYRVIVLKCHPDKTNSDEDSNKLFIKCRDYYDSDFLIGLLYVFYLYKLKPPPPLNNTTPTVPDDTVAILVDRILREIRVIQEKLMEINSPVPDEPTA